MSYMPIELRLEGRVRDWRRMCRACRVRVTFGREPVHFECRERRWRRRHYDGPILRSDDTWEMIHAPRIRA